MTAKYAPLVALLLLFGGLYATTLDSYGMFMWDEAEYASLGRSVLRGEGFSISGEPNPLRPPVLPLAAAASMLISGRSTDTAAKVPNLIFALLGLAIVYLLTSAELGLLAGLSAAALLGMFPAFWLMTANLLAEIPFMAFFAAAVLLLYAGLYRRPRLLLGSWFAFGLALLTRYTALLFLPIAAGFAAVALLPRRRGGAPGLWSRSFFLGPCIAAAVLAPWLIREQVVFGDALVGIKESSTQLQLFMPGVSMPWDYYLLHLPALTHWIPLMLFVLGIGWAVWGRDRFVLHCLGVVVFVLIWFSVYRYKELRMVTSALPFVAIVAAFGLTRTLQRRWIGERWRVALAAVVLMAAFATTAPTVRRIARREITQGYPSFLQAMKFLREKSSRDAVVIGANYPQISWYADRTAVDFPPEDQLPEALKRAEWVVITNFERGQKPYVRRLIDKVSTADVRAGQAALFSDTRFDTLVVRSSLLRKRL